MDIFADLGVSDSSLTESNAAELLDELAKSTTEEIRRQRAHFRVEIKAGVTIQPGNASDLLRFKMQGTTGDLSAGGCRILFPMPVRVGDVYRITFDRQRIDLPMTFARCIRCSLLREDAYEAGFRFFNHVSLPRNLAAETSMTRG